MINNFYFFVFILVLPFSLKSEKCKVGYDSAKEWCFMLQLQGKSALGAPEICNKTGGRIALLDSYKKIEILRTFINEKKEFLLASSIKTQEQDLMMSYHRIRDMSDYADRYCKTYKRFKLSWSTRKLYIPNSELPIHFDANERANRTTPAGFIIKTSSIPGAGLGAWTTSKVPMFTVLGEYEGEEHKHEGDTSYSWIIFEDDEEEQMHFIDASSPSKSNWLRYVNCARNMQEENVKPIICDGLVFYMATKDVGPNTELLTWYGENDGRSLGIARRHPARDLELRSTYYVRVKYKNPHNPYDDFVLFDPFNKKGQHIQREYDYSYYTGTAGLLLPFVCEHSPVDTDIH